MYSDDWDIHLLTKCDDFLEVVNLILDCDSRSAKTLIGCSDNSNDYFILTTLNLIKSRKWLVFKIEVLTKNESL